MPSEWLGVHGGRSYGPVSRGSSLPGPAVYFLTVDDTQFKYYTHNTVSRDVVKNVLFSSSKQIVTSVNCASSA